LQILGYRLAGKHCTYQWQKYRPEPIGPTAKWQHLVAGIFPTAAFLVLLMCQFTLSVFLFINYHSPQNTWIIFPLIAQPTIPLCLYGGWMVFDYLRLRRLIKLK
jgi:hypothetical protein